MLVFGEEMVEVPELFGLQGKRVFLGVISGVEKFVHLCSSIPVADDGLGNVFCLMTEHQFIGCLGCNRFEFVILFNVHYPPIMFIK
jgi:hypothetical protein